MVYEWVQRSRHRRGCRVLGSTAAGGPLVVMTLVCCFKEHVYQLRLLDLWDGHIHDVLKVFANFQIYDVSLDFVVLDILFDNLRFIANTESWAGDSTPKQRVRESQNVCAGCNNFEINDGMPKNSPTIYVPVADLWTKVPLLLSVQNIFELSYHSTD